ncbi:hypothetical protein [Prescottella equi]|uniref:hypothetical protein n=1 Tax=Rhodococcus hoagii TaxID=43767 RepID=UPI00301C6A4C
MAAGIVSRAGEGIVAVGAGATAGIYAVAAGPSATASGDGVGCLRLLRERLRRLAFAMAPGSMARGDFAVDAGPMGEVNHSDSFVFGVDIGEENNHFEAGYTTDSNQVVLEMHSHNVINRGRLVLKSPNGSFHAIHVDGTGQLFTVPVTLSPKTEPKSCWIRSWT